LSVSIRRAVEADLGALAGLFDAYRVFYEQESDPAAAERFLRDRFHHQDSTIFVATRTGSEIVGFVQLYPSFSSVSMRRIFILNDLFVAPSARRTGVGEALIEAAAAHARESGAVRLSLSTAVDNLNAQQLYDKTGFERDAAFYQYHRRLSSAARPGEDESK
jgi:ribosomal protein S18 acetylase RimI-like enzyme